VLHLIAPSGAMEAGRFGNSLQNHCIALVLESCCITAALTSDTCIVLDWLVL
jgi:hypothetical protein